MSPRIWPNHSELKRSSVARGRAPCRPARRRSRHCQHVLAGERLAGDVLAGRVADHAGEVADQEDHLMAQILELAHLVQQHGMAQVQIRRRRIEAGLDAQRPAAFQPLDQVFPLDDFVGATRNRGQRLLKLAHAFSLVMAIGRCGRTERPAEEPTLIVR
jgi:hypothetical protein